MSGTRDTEVKDDEQVPCSQGAYILIGEKVNKQMRKHLTLISAEQRIKIEICNCD